MQNTHPFSEFDHVSTMTLATCGPGGDPHAAAVYFVAIEIIQDQPNLQWRMYFLSDLTSRHAQDLSHRPQVAAAIYPQSQGWKDIRGLQIRATAYIVESGNEWQQAWEAYRLKFPFVTGMEAIVARNTLFGLKPSWVRLVDNRKGFGYKHEWTLDH